MTKSDKRVVLVVEDDPPVRELLDDVLQDEGYEVVAVHDGPSALTVIESLRVDLITLDLDLPGLTGSEFLELMRRRKIDLPPVIVVTGKQPVKRQIKQAARVIITKPFDVDELIQAVLDLLPHDVPQAQAQLKRLVGGDEQTAEAS